MIDDLTQLLLELRRAIDRTPREPTLWYELGQILAQGGDNEEALGAYDHAIDLAPTYAHAHFQRGVVLALLDREEEARRAFCRSVELSPELEEAAKSEAVVHLHIARASSDA